MGLSRHFARQKISFSEWKKKKKREYKIYSENINKKSYLRRIKKLEKYAKQNQLKSGEFYCKSGKIIDQERVQKYEGLCHYMVRKFLPKLMLHEAAFDYEDLVNQCRLEVFLALLDGFDPEKAMSVKEADPVKRAEKLQRKMDDPEAALSKAEKSIVYGRLQNYLRRTRWEYHPDQLGGRTESLDSRDSELSMEDGGLSSDVCFIVSSSVHENKRHLFDVLEDSGPQEAREKFYLLSEESRAELEEHLRSAWGL